MASHLGVLTGIPTIGVGKNMYFIDGMKKDDSFKQKVIMSVLAGGTSTMCTPLFNQQVQSLNKKGDFFDLVGESGRTWGQVIIFI